MVRYRGGYTIVEVMVVIAITALLFLSALILINGQQGDTQFSQTMQDLSSKIQSYVTQIEAGSYPGIENYSCSVPAGTARPILSSSAGTIGTCVILGRAFEVQPTTANKSVIHSYIIMGTRDAYNLTTTNSGQLASSVDQANPEPAGQLDGLGNFQYVLADNYTLGSGAYVVSSKITPVGQTAPLGGEYDLVGLYGQLEGSIDSSSGANPVLSMRGYLYPGLSYPDQSVQLKSCLEETNANSLNCTPASGNLPAISQWLLCINNGGSTTAVLEVDANASGITSKYSVKACS